MGAGTGIRLEAKPRLEIAPLSSRLEPSALNAGFHGADSCKSLHKENQTQQFSVCVEVLIYEAPAAYT